MIMKQSKEPPGCIRKNVYNHACGDCDDQATSPCFQGLLGLYRGLGVVGFRATFGGFIGPRVIGFRATSPCFEGFCGVCRV